MKSKNQYKPRYIDDEVKECSCCEKRLPHSDFYKDRQSGVRGLSWYCKECCKAKQRKYHDENKDRESYWNGKRNTFFKREYGITIQERDKLIEAQEFKCAVCQKELDKYGHHTHTDHCHTTGKVRGILCTNCNRGLGHFQESPEILRAAIDYLARTENGTQKEVTNP